MLLSGGKCLEQCIECALWVRSPAHENIHGRKIRLGPSVDGNMRFGQQHHTRYPLGGAEAMEVTAKHFGAGEFGGPSQQRLQFDATLQQPPRDAVEVSQNMAADSAGRSAHLWPPPPPTAHPPPLYPGPEDHECHELPVPCPPVARRASAVQLASEHSNDTMME
jgi:hypothetical protein